MGCVQHSSPQMAPNWAMMFSATKPPCDRSFPNMSCVSTPIWRQIPLGTLHFSPQQPPAITYICRSLPLLCGNNNNDNVDKGDLSLIWLLFLYLLNFGVGGREILVLLFLNRGTFCGRTMRFQSFGVWETAVTVRFVAIVGLAFLVKFFR